LIPEWILDREESWMRRLAAIIFTALSLFLLLSCAGTSTPQDGPNTTSTLNESDIITPDPALEVDPPEIELDRAALLASSEVDITYAQEYARNRALANFKKFFPNLIISDDASDENILDEIGEKYLWEEALPSMNEMIETNPENPELHLLSGYINWKLRYTEVAIAAFEKTIELDPKNFDAHFYLGIIYYGTEELIKSVDYLTQATRLAHRHNQISDAFANRGLAYCLMELYDECVADVERAIYLDPYNGFTILIHGTVFKDKAQRESEATGLEGIPGLDFGVTP
jgi:tetratricopeptide (TPR) repeat protein